MTLSCFYVQTDNTTGVKTSNRHQSNSILCQYNLLKKKSKSCILKMDNKNILVQINVYCNGIIEILSVLILLIKYVSSDREDHCYLRCLYLYLTYEPDLTNLLVHTLYPVKGYTLTLTFL